MQDEGLHGVTSKDGNEYKLSQFADDTQFFLRGFDDLQRLEGIIFQYEQATGMRANMNKFEGMRLGKTRRQAVPDNEFTRIHTWPHADRCPYGRRRKRVVSGGELWCV